VALSEFVVAPLGTQEGPPPDNYAVFYYAGIVDDYPWQLDTEQSVGDLSFLDYGDVLPMFQLEWIDEGTQALVQIGSLATGDLPNLYDRPAIVPAAVSSQLDDTGEERIHIAHVAPVAFTYLSPAVTKDVRLWTDYVGTGGVGFDTNPSTTSFNTELDDAAEVLITSYYIPEIPESHVAAEFPPSTDPLPVNLAGFTEVPIAPITLTSGNESPGPDYWWAPYAETSEIGDGTYFANVSVDGTDVLAVIRVGGGF